MGGKPIKPKIQAYVDQRWFDEFEVYRASHDLNQSKALQKILAEFFGGASASTLQPDGLDTVATSALVDSLRSELTELRHELDHRLQLVESRLAIESAIESTTSTDATTSTDESATESATTQDELALPLDESAVHLDGLATDSAMKQSESAIPLDESAIESASESVVGITESASESATWTDESASESATGQDEPVVHLDGLATELATNQAESAIEQYESASESAIIEDVAIAAVNPLEAVSLALRERLPAPLSAAGLAQRLGVDVATINRNKAKSADHFKRWSKKRDPDSIAWEYRLAAKVKYHPLV